MKLISMLISLFVLLLIAVVLCFVFFAVTYNVNGYDIQLASRKDEGRWIIGVRYKNECMLHIYKERTVGDSVNDALDWWRQRTKTGTVPASQPAA